MANQIQLVMYEGYMADDPDMRYTPDGKAVVNFRMGSNRKYKKADGKEIKETIWLKISAWGKLAEIVNQYTAKGSHVVVTGILRAGENGSPNVYELKSGGHGASYEITANEVRILKGKEREDNPEEDTEEDIPF